jgi:hypothetical protein
MAVETVTLAIIIGTLAAIVYSLRILVLLERRVSRIDDSLIRIVRRIELEEQQIASEEKKIERMMR